MQDYRLDGTANVVLRYTGTLVNNQSLNFIDAKGRKLLVLACRIRQVRGQKVAELLLNAVNEAGVWGAELSTEVPALALASGLELRFRSWRIEVLLDGQLRMACNPTASFGPGADPALAVSLQTNCAAAALTLQTGASYGRALAEADQPQGSDLTLVLLHPGDPAALRAEYAELAYRFREMVIVNPYADLPEGQLGTPTIDRAINAALAQVTTPYVAIASGSWVARDFGRSVAQFAATLSPDSFMPMSISTVMRPGECWGLLLPARIGGQPAVKLRNGVVVIDPKLTSAAYWQVSRQWTAPAVLHQMRQDSAIQPLVLKDSGLVSAPVHRMALQAYVLIPGGTDDKTGGAWPFSGLRLDTRPLTGGLTPRHILAPLCMAAEESCSSLFMLWTPQAGTMARATAWARLGLLYDIGLAMGEGNRPAGLMVSRDCLAPAIFTEIDALDRDAFNQPCADITEAIERLVALVTRLGILVVRNRLAELDAQPVLQPQGRLLFLPTSAVVDAQLAPKPLAKEPEEPVRPVNPLTGLPIEPLPEPVTELLTPAQIAEKAAQKVADKAVKKAAALHAARPDLPDEGDAFETLALQALQHGKIAAICDYAIAADLRLPAARFVDRLVATFQSSGWAGDPNLRATLMEALIARNHHDALMPLMDGLRPDVLDADLRLRLRDLDVLLRCRNLQDRFYNTPANMGLPDRDDTTLNPGIVGHYLDSLTFYLALRQDWQAILDLIAKIKVPDRAAHGFYERWMIARIETGQTAGLAAELRDLRQTERLTAWSVHRLNLRLARASKDSIAEQDAVQHLLREEAPLQPLLQPPTRFRQIGLAATASDVGSSDVGPSDVGPDQIACILVARNEFFRLKWLHQYYRQLGVDRFFLIDNVSDDETIDYFARQPDVTILQTDAPYRDSCYGVKWHNEVAEAYLEGRWVLTVDADEALVFEGSQNPDALRDLCARLDAEGADGFFAPMIDMYSKDRLDETDYAPGDSLMDRFTMFDSGPYRFDPTPGYPKITVSGGVRIRLFWNNRHDIDVPHLAMQKVPLVRWTRGFRYLASTHDMTPLTVSGETGALLHYKFMPDFHRRAMEEVQRNQHYEGAREYRIYAAFLNDPANRSFVHPGSARYEGPATLTGLGLLAPPKTAPDTTRSAAWLQHRHQTPQVSAAEGGTPAVLAEGTARQLALAAASRGRIPR